ncbi:MAG: Bax inhibitor-1/YccA family protein [Dehalococcoidia bacterium]|nr:Bax inhibitor-1/YccA family protein [Dehalococcoidia bacterium]
MNRPVEPEVGIGGSQMNEYPSVGARIKARGAEVLTATPSRVLGLLAFTFVFTAVGAVVGSSIGRAALLPGIIAGFATLMALLGLRERSPINLGLLYAFGALEGVVLGVVLDAYVARGLSGAIFQAAVTTAGVTLVAGAYGATTKRDLTWMGNILFTGLVSVIVASVLGIVSSVLFTGYIIYDMQQVVAAKNATEGDAILFAVNIYLDILNLFLNLLQLLGGGDD